MVVLNLFDCEVLLLLAEGVMDLATSSLMLATSCFLAGRGPSLIMLL